ncbi:MAG: carboxypeptidase-like regulatory domain-containing protein [Bryobacteraceae bacterium]|nr:carboxypeptidase-like regulatory domain-containing protein [Bryobacteraceae bacterium]MDW8379717.1 carboxypeptidase-like regulatory domain-containing protein [Bryobacterales bacterium]
MMRCLLLTVCLPLWAAVDGVVINGTTGKPQPGAAVTLFKLGNSGMQPVETVQSDAQGKFSFSYSPASDSASLLQATFEGVTYSKMLNPGAPTASVELEVFQAQTKPGEAKVSQHMILFEPVDGKLIVSENVIYQNTGKTTYYDPAGSFQFYLPKEAGGRAKVMCAAPSGMPVERKPQPTKTPGIYAVDFPIKPGETRFQLSYEMPMPEPPVFSGRILHKEGQTRLVTPRGVTLKSDLIQELGREPTTQAAIYSVKSGDFRVEIEGSGALSEIGSEAGGEGPTIQEIMPRIYERLFWVLGLTAAILLLGFLLLYRKDATESLKAPILPGKGKRRA